MSDKAKRTVAKLISVPDSIIRSSGLTKEEISQGFNKLGSFLGATVEQIILGSDVNSGHQTFHAASSPA